jgi:hypothetical protein
MFGLGGVKWAETQFEKLAGREQGKAGAGGPISKAGKKTTKKSQ